MIDVTIIGASGYTGGELIRLLEKHEKVRITGVSSRKYDGEAVYKVHQNLRGSDLVFKNLKPEDIDADLVFTATPHGYSMKIVPELVESGIKVIDLSGDYRFRDFSVYEKYYGLKHTNPLDAVYGLPEIYRSDIKKATLVANPGCFPTGAILSSFVLSKMGIVDRLVFDSKTGVSGGGISPNEAFHFPNVYDNVNPYNIVGHRHGPEIQEELKEFSNVLVSFTPHLVPVIRGILTTCHGFSNNINKSNDVTDFNVEDIHEEYKKQFKDEIFVKVLDIGEIPKLSSVRGSNFAHIGGFEVDETGRLVIISAIDNLVKGASGQAIHNMNIMFGFKEDESISHYGLAP
ncbi:N-acetyl-gamma-glutamyl-phosphate reductase [Methanobrevibacter curvatus]|uniref:N-acetyl-gamma-glutamyl-phosphate reductase n=1 Tax=Methanobrevibacter curvatus TaxID=49547 RepID=A0A165YXA8_9EURY|nr:N-acetyl-gamma-glutamyl-phosphate reductase [Methanobrevibacter curvatus]KZX09979.1 N-acetyl-gamma-glutamyl-phosphate reductase [Methanobrevibacter curvatus]